MSGGTICKCPESKRPIAERKWRVLNYRCNYSAFSGYHYTSSDYSAICCDECDRSWRTKAGYVEKLLDNRG